MNLGLIQRNIRVVHVTQDAYPGAKLDEPEKRWELTVVPNNFWYSTWGKLIPNSFYFCTFLLIPSLFSMFITPIPFVTSFSLPVTFCEEFQDKDWQKKKSLVRLFKATLCKVLETIDYVTSSGEIWNIEVIVWKCQGNGFDRKLWVCFKGKNTWFNEH